MAFHITNFGSFSGRLNRYADRNGYVPERKDRLRDMDYGGDELGQSWAEFKAEAARATKEAQKEVWAWVDAR